MYLEMDDTNLTEIFKQGSHDTQYTNDTLAYTRKHMQKVNFFRGKV